MQILPRVRQSLEQRIFWVLALINRSIDKITRKQRRFAVVERRCLGKTVEFSEKAIVGLRVGYVFPFAQLKQIYVNGKRVSGWYKIKCSDQIVIAERPNGDFGGEFLQIAVGIALLFVPGGQALGTGLIVSGSTGILTKLLFPVETKEGDLSAPASRPVITGAENTISKSVVPVLFGKSKVAPFYGQRPYRLVGDGSGTNKFLQYFTPTFKNVSVSQEKLGDTLISDFSADYLSVSRQFGTSTFIGHRNVKAVSVEQQLTYDTETSVSQSVEHIYNQAATGSSLVYDFQLTFSDVAVGNFSDKTFQVDIVIKDDVPATKTITHQFVVTEASLVSIGGGSYTYTGTYTFTQNVTEVTSTKFFPVTSTRQNTAEEDALTEVVIDEQEITVGAFNTTTTLGNGVNKYFGLLSEVLVTTPDDTVEADLIFSFPAGSYTQQSDGSKTPRGVNVDIDIKPDGGSYAPIGNYTTYVRQIDDSKGALGSTTVNGSQVTFESVSASACDEQFFRTIGVTLPEGKYTFRVRSADLAAKRDVDIGYVVMSEFNFEVSGNPVNPDILPDLMQYSLEAVAYGRLSGELKQFNCIAEAQVPDWNGSNWDTVQVTRNPASVVRYLLTSELANPRPEPLANIDNDSLVELHTWCATKGYKADGFIFEQKRILNVVQSILSNCQASFTIIDGKFVFVIDDPAKPIVNQITPHNSFDFKWTPSIGKTTNAVRVTYLDGDTFQDSEFTLYYYDGAVYETPKAGTADEDYEMLVQQAEYCTDVTHLKSLYTTNLKLLQEKRNLFEFSVNLEGLALQLYDRIYVANSVNMKNSSSGLIKTVLTSGGNITGFQLYSSVEVLAGDKITIRSIDIPNAQVVVNSYSITNSGFVDVVTIAPVVYNGLIKGQGSLAGFSGSAWQYDGDIFEIGQDKMYECVVLNVRYKEDLTATITAREA